MRINNQIKTGAVLSYLSIGINMVTGLIYTPWMINQIGKNDYGLYTLALSLITLFLVDFGLSSAASRFLSKYVAEGEHEKANSFLGAIYKLYIIIDAIIFIALIIIFFFIDIIYDNLTPEEISKFKVVYIIASMYALINFPFITLNGVLTAYEKFFQLKLAEIISRVLIVVMTVCALWLGMGLYALVTVNAVAGIIIIAFKLFVIRKVTPIKVNFKNTEKGIYKSIFSFSFWTTLSNLAQRLILTITPTILGIVANSAEIAIFGVIQTLEQYVYTIANAINGMFMPKISKIYTEEQANENLMSLLIKVGCFQFAINGLIVAGFLSIGKQFVELWMGNGFEGVYIGVLLIAIPGLFYNSLQVANTAMVVKNKVKEQAYIAIIMGLINVSLSFVLANKFGAVGCAISIFIALIARDIMYHIVHKKIMKIDILLFIKKCYFKMFPPVLITILVGLLLNNIILINTWLILVVKAAILGVVYLASLLCFSLNKNERKSIRNAIKLKTFR